MGNSQSNNSKNTNYKRFKVTEVDQNGNSSWFRLHVDDYVKYQITSKGRWERDDWKYIDLDKVVFVHLLINIEVGDYVIIDLNKTKREECIHTFKSNDVCLPVRTDSNGNVVNLIGDVLESVSNFGQAMEESRKYVASIEQSHYADNPAWTKQTSWDIPPNWK